MHWVIQENLFMEPKFEDLISFLKKMNIPHTMKA